MSYQKLKERTERFPVNWKEIVTDKTTKRIVELYLNPSLMSLETIAKRIGITHSAVSARIKKASQECQNEK